MADLSNGPAGGLTGWLTMQQGMNPIIERNARLVEYLKQAPLEREKMANENAMTGAQVPFAGDYAQAKLFGSPFEQQQAQLNYGLKSDDLALRRAEQERALRMQEWTMKHQSEQDRVRNAQLERQIKHDQDTLNAGTIPSGYRKTSTGGLEAVPGGPADVKAQQAAQLKATGATDVDIAVSALRDAYDRLEKGGGITSTENSALENVPAWASASSGGQFLGKLFGTQNQSARNDIAMTRPALLAALMKATGMTARQVDSNAELKLWLTTATDPTLDVQSNRRALANIERKYLSVPSAKPVDPRVVGNYRFPSVEAANEFRKQTGQQ